MNGPHQGGWIHTKYGEDWFIHFQDKGPYGRVCHLQPVDWSSGWPVMGNAGEPYWKFRKPKSDSKTIVNPVETDEFDSSKLGMQWQWQMIIKKVTVKLQVWGFSACLRTHYLSLEMSVICGMYRICYYRKYRLMNLQLPQS